MTGPMRPEDAAIASRMSGKSATVLQKDVVDALVAKGFERDDIFARQHSPSVRAD